MSKMEIISAKNHVSFFLKKISSNLELENPLVDKSSNSKDSKTPFRKPLTPTISAYTGFLKILYYSIYRIFRIL